MSPECRKPAECGACRGRQAADQSAGSCQAVKVLVSCSALQSPKWKCIRCAWKATACRMHGLTSSRWRQGTHAMYAWNNSSDSGRGDLIRGRCLSASGAMGGLWWADRHLEGAVRRHGKLTFWAVQPCGSPGAQGLRASPQPIRLFLSRAHLHATPSFSVITRFFAPLTD